MFTVKIEIAVHWCKMERGYHSLYRTTDRLSITSSCSVFCHVARLPDSTAARQALKLQVDISLSLSTDFHAVPTGSAVPVVRTSGGLINCIRITTLQPTYGVPPSGVAIPERRYGPRWLRDDDDDDGVRWYMAYGAYIRHYTAFKKFVSLHVWWH